MTEETQASEEYNVSVCAIMSTPRYGSNAARGIIETALHEFTIPLYQSQGVYWGKCMEQRFTWALEKGIDWIIAIDFDSVFSKEHLGRLLGIMGAHPEIDALSCMQGKRDGINPLFSLHGLKPGENSSLKTDCRTPFQVYTAHFGLTIIRSKALTKMERPWFLDVPPADLSKSGEPGAWIDADIEFWRRWDKAGNTLFVDPAVRIGHIEETVLVHDETYQLKRISLDEWLKDPAVRRQSYRTNVEEPGAEDTEEGVEASGDGDSEGSDPAGRLEISAA